VVSVTSAFHPRGGRWPIGLLPLGALAAIMSIIALAVGSLMHLGARDLVSPELLAKTVVAERTMVVAEQLIAQAKLSAGITPSPGTGPDPSGLIGDEMTPLVTTLGILEAKRIATNPAWARILTVKLAQAGVGQGSVVAAGYSGSFPGLDLAVTAACGALGARLMAISSVTASTWGANQPGFTWPEIEQRLVAAGIIRRASIAVSAGGRGDRALDLDPDGRAEAEWIMRASAEGLGVSVLTPATYDQAIAERLALYDRERRGRPIALYVNVGGTDASLGRSASVLRLRSGLLPGIPFDFSNERGVMARMAERGVAVLTLLNIRDLALRWGVPLCGPRQGR
jgi:poly-gamma-glutamate system protein